jgi:DNA-binding NarL/FixJ family response regulator
MKTTTNGNNMREIDEVYRALGAIHAGVLKLMEMMGNSEAYLEGLLATKAHALGEVLTGTELEVAIAMAKRIPRAQIAAARFVAPKTLEKQVATAMHKLGFDDCREFQGWIQGVRWQLGGVQPPENVGVAPDSSLKPSL